MSGYPARVRWRLGCVVVQEYEMYHFPSLSGEAGFGTAHRLIVLPYWAVALAAAGLPAVSLRHILRGRRRRRLGRCWHCGYDLRASPDRCPECGALPGRSGVA
jgi:hypothetical protein